MERFKIIISDTLTQDLYSLFRLVKLEFQWNKNRIILYLLLHLCNYTYTIYILLVSSIIYYHLETIPFLPKDKYYHDYRE